MLPQERAKAVDILVEHQFNHLVSHHDGHAKKMLACGFKGFAAFTDEELILSLKKIRDGNYEASNLLSQIIDSELLR